MAGHNYTGLAYQSHQPPILPGAKKRPLDGEMPVRVHETTIEQLADRLAPFVNAKLNRQRDPASKYGAFLPLTHAVDIRSPGISRIDADIRAINADGIRVSRGGFPELVRWADLTEVSIRRIDAAGNTLATRTYSPASERRAA